ncbi:hypothetical protein E4V99_12325 [Microbacterium sp. dk485]|uniref:hypothetical protein n=1 Tax=Microbacterium sp. dk485 TaxID=2560021 RepID=UPI001074318C|nr:hypothetical protein [Microbacterium sp. dk485]TFV81749.1 hypothetical protein E4V99_12325 [Microbacterium sp. dk485]
MRWPWQRTARTAAPAVPAGAPPEPAGWAFFPPVQTTIADGSPGVLAADFLPSLPLRTDPSFLGGTAVHGTGDAPGGTIDLDPVAGSPAASSGFSDLALRRTAGDTSGPARKPVPALAQREAASSEPGLDAVSDAGEGSAEPSSPPQETTVTQVPATDSSPGQQPRASAGRAGRVAPVVSRRLAVDADGDAGVEVDAEDDAAADGRAAADGGTASRPSPTTRDAELLPPAGSIPPRAVSRHDLPAVSRSGASRGPEPRVVARIPPTADALEPLLIQRRTVVGRSADVPVTRDPRASTADSVGLPAEPLPAAPVASRHADGDASRSGSPAVAEATPASRWEGAAEVSAAGSAAPAEAIEVDVTPVTSQADVQPLLQASPTPSVLQRTVRTESLPRSGAPAVGPAPRVRAPAVVRPAVQLSTRGPESTAPGSAAVGFRPPVLVAPLPPEQPPEAPGAAALHIQRAALVPARPATAPQPPDPIPVDAPTHATALVQRLATRSARVGDPRVPSTSEAFSGAGWHPSVQQLREGEADAASAPTPEAAPAPNPGPAASVMAGAVPAPAAPAAVPTRPEEVDALAAALYPAMVRRLRAELLTDRERRGVRIDGV